MFAQTESFCFIFSTIVDKTIDKTIVNDCMENGTKRLGLCKTVVNLTLVFGRGLNSPVPAINLFLFYTANKHNRFSAEGSTAQPPLRNSAHLLVLLVTHQA